jgi:hypothetical protein
MTSFFYNIELRCAYASAEIEGQRTICWIYSVLTSAGVGYIAALRAYEQMIEKQNRTTMGPDPLKCLDQIRSLISMLEYFDAATTITNAKSDTAVEPHSNKRNANEPGQIVIYAF